jgi:hypothetical protein
VFTRTLIVAAPHLGHAVLSPIGFPLKLLMPFERATAVPNWNRAFFA